MNKTVLMAASAAIALTFASGAMAAGSAPALHSAKSGKAHRVKSQDHTQIVLYDQSGSDSSIAIVSQTFESTFAQYDNQGADDFTVPAGPNWRVTEVDVPGQYFNGPGPATSLTVTFYKNDPVTNTPGAVRRVYANVVPTSDNFGSFVITLPNDIGLRRGTHWMSVVANEAFAVGGEWGWENQTSSVGFPAAWRNPGGGFGTGCTDWETENTCIADGQGDHMFTIKGHLGRN